MMLMFFLLLLFIFVVASFFVVVAGLFSLLYLAHGCAFLHKQFDKAQFIFQFLSI